MGICTTMNQLSSIFWTVLEVLRAFDTVWTQWEKTSGRRLTRGAHKALRFNPVKIFIQEAESGWRGTCIQERATTLKTMHRNCYFTWPTSCSKNPFSQSSDKEKIPWGGRIFFPLPRMNLRMLPLSCMALGRRNEREHLVWKAAVKLYPKHVTEAKIWKINGRSGRDCPSFLTMCLIWQERMRISYRPLRHSLTHNCAVSFTCFTNLRLLWGLTVSYWDPTKNVNCIDEHYHIQN